MKVANKFSTLLCDDIRQEMGGKLSFIGVYSKDIIFREIPTIYPKLCLGIVIEGVKDVFADVKAVLKIPESDDIVMKLKAPEKMSVNDNLTLNITISPFRVKAAGQARFDIYFGNAKRPSVSHKFGIKVIEKK